jgi:hypothetical protein
MLLHVDFELLTREGTISPAQSYPLTSKRRIAAQVLDILPYRDSPESNVVMNVYDVAGRRVYRSAAAMRGGWREVGSTGIDNDGRALHERANDRPLAPWSKSCAVSPSQMEFAPPNPQSARWGLCHSR